MTEANTLWLFGDTDQGGRAVIEKRPDRPALFPGLMSEVRRWLGGRKVAEQLAAIIGCDIRSAARYLAGDRIPSGDVVFAMMLDPVIGPRVMAFIAREARRKLSDKDFETFRMEMAEATLMAFARDKSR